LSIILVRRAIIEVEDDLIVLEIEEGPATTIIGEEIDEVEKSGGNQGQGVLMLWG